MSNNKGVALVVAIFVLVVFAVMAVVMISLMTGENILSLREYNSTQAFQLAEAGIRFTVASSLAADSDWSNNTGLTKNLSPGYFTVSYDFQTRRTCTLRVTGVVGGISRTIVSGFRKSGYPSAFDYGIYCNNYATETLYIQNSATIYGDFMYLGDVIMENTATLVNGTMYSESLELRNSAACASWEVAPVIDPPVFDSSYYDNLLAECTRSATSALDLTGGTMNLGGTTHYYTSVTIRNDAVVTGPGRLVSTTGNFELNNTARIGNDVMVIVKGTSSLNNSSVIGSNFNLISRSSITVNNSQNVPAEAVFFSYGDITFDNTATFWGSILAPSGEVSSVNSTTFNGLIYGDVLNLQNTTKLYGSAAVGSIGYFKNSTVVTYDPSKLPSEVPMGFEGGGGSSEEGFTTTDWSEIF